MRFSAFYDSVAPEWSVCVVHPDGLDYNINLKKGHDYCLEWLEKNKDRYIKSVCRVVVDGAGGYYGYDVELLPEGAPEQDVIFDEYERQGAVPW